MPAGMQMAATVSHVQMFHGVSKSDALGHERIRFGHQVDPRESPRPVDTTVMAYAAHTHRTAAVVVHCRFHVPAVRHRPAFGRNRAAPAAGAIVNCGASEGLRVGHFKHFR